MNDVTFRPVMQSITDHDPEAGRYGDCYRACIASVLSLPLESVPHFADGCRNDSDWKERCLPKANAWLAARNLTPLTVCLEDISDHTPDGDVLSIVVGQSGRGIAHSVLYQGGKMVHDPHPAGIGLTGPREPEGFYFIEVLLPISYSAMIAHEQQVASDE